MADLRDELEKFGWGVVAGLAGGLFGAAVSDVLHIGEPYSTVVIFLFSLLAAFGHHKVRVKLT